jgi:hypothetical protein
MNVELISNKYYKYFWARPDSWINVYPKVYFIRGEEKHTPGVMALGPSYRSLDRNKIYGNLTQYDSIGYTRDIVNNDQHNEIKQNQYTMSLEDIDKLKDVKVNIALGSVIELTNINNNERIKV